MKKTTNVKNCGIKQMDIQQTPTSLIQKIRQFMKNPDSLKWIIIGSFIILGTIYKMGMQTTRQLDRAIKEVSDLKIRIDCLRNDIMPINIYNYKQIRGDICELKQKTYQKELIRERKLKRIII